LAVFSLYICKKYFIMTIPAEIVQATRMSEQELLVEVAVMLFIQEKLTLGQAALLAGKPQFQFQAILASRDIPIHYDIPEYQEDLKTIARLGS